MAVRDLFRLMRGAYVLAREGVATSLPFPEPIPMPIRAGLWLARLIQRKSTTGISSAERITAAVNRLGPSYIKLGQFLATRPDVVGARMASDLSALQDNVPAYGEALARAEIEASLGRPVEAIFTEFSAPIAAASIAQVHKASFIDPATGLTRQVAVKVLRPGVAKRFSQDLNSFYMAARLIERFFPAVRRLKPVAIVDTLARSVILEMDFRLEAAALSEMGENVQHDSGFRVPAIDWHRSSKSVLTMEWIDGVKMADIERIRAEGHDLKKLAATLIQSFLRHAMRDGFFHADMHQGNLFVDPAGVIVAVDFGIMGRQTPAQRRFLAEILFGFIRRNYRRVAEVHFEAGYVPAHHDIDSFAQALRAIGEPLQGHTAADISMARLLTQLFEVTDLFDMETRPELIMLQKTMVVVEGVARTLDPELDMWKTAEPVVSEWIARNLGPLGKIEDGVGLVGRLFKLAENLPEFAARADAMGEALRAKAEADRERQRTLNGLRWPLWIAAIALLILSIRSLW